MSHNMKTLLLNTKFYNFSRKFWQVTAYLKLFWGATGGKNFTGGPPLCPLLRTAPAMPSSTEYLR